MERLRGIFPVVQTPFRADLSLDLAGLDREVEFCRRAGAHGLVYPVLASEFQMLTDQERKAAVERVLAAARMPVVVGVAATSRQGAAEFARHAAGAGAAAVIALPPYVGAPGPDEIHAYYAAIAEAARVPVFIQDAPPGLPVARILRLLREIDNVRYVKEENEPSAHNISTLLDALGDDCWGVFGGAWCRWMMSEMARGAHGFMPSVEVADVHVRIWELFQAGQTEAARALYNRLLPFINLGFCLGLRYIKEALVRRGVIAASHMRRPGMTALDAYDQQELDAIFADMDDILTLRHG